MQNLFPCYLAALAYWLLSVVIVHDGVRTISKFSHFLIKKGVTFFSAARNVRHSARLGAEMFSTLFGLLLLIVYLVLSLFMMMCTLFPDSESHYIISETGYNVRFFQFKSLLSALFRLQKFVVCAFLLQKFIECAFLDKKSL